MFIVKFKELNDWDKFIFKHNQYIKIPQRDEVVQSCCNPNRITKVNAKRNDEKCVWFDAEEEVIWAK